MEVYATTGVTVRMCYRADLAEPPSIASSEVVDEDSKYLEASNGASGSLARNALHKDGREFTCVIFASPLGCIQEGQPQKSPCWIQWANWWIPSGIEPLGFDRPAEFPSGRGQLRLHRRYRKAV